MAIVTATLQVKMTAQEFGTPSDFASDDSFSIRSSNSTQIVADFNGAGLHSELVLQGSFNGLSGTMNNYKETYDNGGYVYVTGLSYGIDLDTDSDTDADFMNLTDWLSGNDQITASSFADTVRGFSGDDTIRGAGGDDVLYGGVGNVDPGSGQDIIFGEEGNDTIFGNGGSDLLYGGKGAADPNDGNDLIYGGLLYDQIYGNTGNDTLYGGGSGSDLADSDDTIYGGLGNDIIYGNAGNDTIYGGGSGADTLDSADTIYGGYGNDKIYGNAGADVIRGSIGLDTIYGGLGDDQFVYDGTTAQGDDQIIGFEGAGQAGGDLIVIAASQGFATAADVIAASTVAFGSTVIHLNDDFQSVDATQGATILLQGVTGLTADDIMII